MIRDLYPAVDRVLRPFGMYAAYQLTDAEFVTHVGQSYPGDVREFLVEHGYEPTGVLSAAKYHPTGGRPDDGSLRRVDPEDDRRQYHVHLFGGPFGTAVFSHLEYRPDLRPVGDELLFDAVERASEHYRPTWGREWGDGVTYVLGACCPAVDELGE